MYFDARLTCLTPNSTYRKFSVQWILFYIYLITSCFVPLHFTSLAVEVHALPLLVYLMVPSTTSIFTALSNLGQNAFLYF
ncbi:hypothetical protein BDP27DRAFT_1316861, partial [Rhodocollybia butyracea]